MTIDKQETNVTRQPPPATCSTSSRSYSRTSSSSTKSMRSFFSRSTAGGGKTIEDIKSSNTVDYEYLFFLWLGVVALFFLALTGTLFAIQFHLEKDVDDDGSTTGSGKSGGGAPLSSTGNGEATPTSTGRQIKMLHYLLTFSLLYLYTRMIMHHVTKFLLMKSSKIFPTIPEPVRNDTAFFVVDAASFLLWFPILFFAAFKIYQIGNNQEFFHRYGPLAYMLLAVYHIDRILQLFCMYRQDRFIHHFLTCIWTLLYLEWYPEGRDAGILIFGGQVESMGKILWYWFACGRFARRHYKNIMQGRHYYNDQEGEKEEYKHQEGQEQKKGGASLNYGVDNNKEDERGLLVVEKQHDHHGCDEDAGGGGGGDTDKTSETSSDMVILAGDEVGGNKNGNGSNNNNDSNNDDKYQSNHHDQEEEVDEVLSGVDRFFISKNATTMARRVLDTPMFQILWKMTKTSYWIMPTTQMTTPKQQTARTIREGEAQSSQQQKEEGHQETPKKENHMMTSLATSSSSSATTPAPVHHPTVELQLETREEEGEGSNQQEETINTTNTKSTIMTTDDIV